MLLCEQLWLAMDAIIYQNPECGKSRNTLGLIRNAGIEPHVIEYLKTPPTRALLVKLIKRMGISVPALLRIKGTPYDDLGLDNPGPSHEQPSTRWRNTRF
jgi:arsenate reductase